MRKILAILLLFASAQLFAANAALEKTVTLKQLSTQNSINFIGPGAEKALYLPTPLGWKINAIQLHLLVKNSNLPHRPTSLTAFINNQPIQSFNLQSLQNGIGEWNLTIPASVITENNTTVLIKSGWESNDTTTCKNFSDPSFWSSIDGQSTITYQYTENETKAVLTTFPQPFINPFGIEKDAVTIVLPDQFNHDDLEALFYVAQTLTRLQTWRGMNITGVKASELTDVQKNSTNLIFIGSSQHASFNSPLIKWPLTQNEKHEWLDKQRQKIADDTGIVMIAPSPWNLHHIVLAVTGNGDSGTAKAALWLRSPRLTRSLLSLDYVLTNQTDTKMLQTPDWSDTRFNALGFNSQTVYGDGESTLNYVIKLPPDKIAKSMDINLKYTTSPLLSKTANSFLSLTVNQAPISSIRLEPGTVDEQQWKVHIKREDLLRGDNLLSFTFHLKFHNNTCANDDQRLAYATLKSNSTLSVRFRSEQASVNFHTFNASDNNVALLLPHQHDYFTQSLFISSVIEFAKALINTPSFVVAFNDSDIGQLYGDRNLIYIGKLDDNPSLAKQRSQFPFLFKSGLLDIRPSLLPLLSMNGETPDALLEIIPSPFNLHRSLLFICTNATNHYDLALDVLTDTNKNKYLKGDTALIYANGTFTSINAQQLQMKVENKHRLSEAHILSSTGLISFLVVFFGGLILLILYRRLRRYFSKNDK
jgi:hypothetical protein